ncbi:hypothetical protein EaACW_2661 [Erwinia amylovora ACW56400]|uniref:Uncharacterized protein n=1 Tax=Erwinia amylovora NBRC 12687 = CFBP 1232 TaxID=1219359 RepID=A0A831ETC0_ERWAM|nr:hypothetical protein EaACW_2661 [Erwinia amylovora ACW56400]CCO79505.1 hypothetical protein BN432_2726 [Erwinia amylovora Ea356]CCO87070.1 hypothetical protein BN434_2700 [Erwinia amylovora CFBP 2585]CCO90865.1 hypothetical protein BN435_2713 [Erwinia amylovora 01SFR-BO]CCO94647.1 hypothetical protein BN437_2737 [Erwinia amylovora NBRC 12687 = CFBP 1232]CCO99978.1 hypothetical protein BN438_2713 [Erwinia amylovora UPN527]
MNSADHILPAGTNGSGRIACTGLINKSLNCIAIVA